MAKISRNNLKQFFQTHFQYWQEIFYILTVALLLFSGLELLWPRLVSTYLNLNILLLFWVSSAIILLISNKEDK